MCFHVVTHIDTLKTRKRGFNMRTINGKKIKGTGVIVRDNMGTYLLIQRDDSKEIGLVGGGFEGDELAYDCAKRELLEEVGIDIDEYGAELRYIGLTDSPANPYKQESEDGISENFIVDLPVNFNDIEIIPQEGEVLSTMQCTGLFLKSVLESDDAYKMYPASQETLEAFEKLNGGRL